MIALVADVFWLRREHKPTLEDIGTRIGATVVAARLAAAVDQLEAAYQQLEPSLNDVAAMAAQPTDTAEEKEGDPDV